MERDYNHMDMFFNSPEGDRFFGSTEGKRFIMEWLGYLDMAGDPPPEESTRQVEAVFGQNHLQNNLQNKPSFRYCKGGDESKSFIQGNDVCFSTNMSLFQANFK